MNSSGRTAAPFAMTFWHLLWATPILAMLTIELAFGIAFGPRFELARRKDIGSGYWYLIFFHLFLFVVVAVIIFFGFRN